MRTKKKRITKAERAIANAERLAKLLISAPPDGDTPLAPPSFINDRRLAPALQFWKDHAEEFIKLGTLERPDRFMFALLCIYVAEFISAEDDILANGYSVRVKTVSGGMMPRESPSVARRDFAMKVIADLSRSFGLTKLDRLNLSRLQRANSSTPSLFADGDRPVEFKNPDTTDPELLAWRKLLRRDGQVAN